MSASLFRRDRVFDFLAPPLLPQTLVDTRHGPILYIEDISVSFDGFKALNNLNLTIDDGELRCIIGANGAGKTTMMDVVTGRTQPDSGSAWFGSRVNLLGLDEPAIASVGIGRKFQKPTVFENLTVIQNLELAAAGNKGVWHLLRTRLTAEQGDAVAEVLTVIDLEKLATELAGTLSHGQKQLLEIGMLLMQRPRLLLLDEPVAGMTGEEIERTSELLLKLAGDHSVVVVEHDMEFVRSIASRVTVLHEGSVLAEGDMSDIQNDPRVIEVYLGE